MEGEEGPEVEQKGKKRTEKGTRRGCKTKEVKNEEEGQERKDKTAGSVRRA